MVLNLQKKSQQERAADLNGVATLDLALAAWDRHIVPLR